jgi:hypothetical protein
VKTTLRTAALTIALGLFGLAGTAQAQQANVQAPKVQAPQVQAPKAAAKPAMRTPAETKAAITAAAQRTNMPHYVAPNGKVVFNAHEPLHLDAMDGMSAPGNGMLQIMLSEGNQHTFGHFEGRYLHFQYVNGTNNWRLRPWADRLRPSNRRMFGAMIQLSPEEAANLRTRIAGIFAEEGPEHLAGPRWENGHIKESVGVRGFNCASAWCSMPIGEKGESIATLIGIPSNGEPFSLQRSLESGGNEKIVGIGLYGPKQENFKPETHQVYAR